MSTYLDRMDTPMLVVRARMLAREHEFEHSSITEVGRLLATLAAAVTDGRIGEIGTGFGVGAAWIADVLRAEVTYVTIDNDEARIAAAGALLGEYTGVRVVHGDWSAIKAHGPFKLLFADGGKAKVEQPDTLIDLLEIGGVVVLDDLTPEEYWPEEWKGQPDPVREFWLKSQRVVSTEIRVTPGHAVILATRIG